MSSRPTKKRRIAKEELLSGKVFYLDLSEGNAEKLKKQILQYGGDVSLSFDAKVVTHLITGKKLPPGADTSMFTSNITSSLGSDEPNKTANKPKAIPAHIARSTDSPNKRMASMIQAVQSNTSLIDIARKFNIKVMHLSTFVSWLNEQGTAAVITPPVTAVPFISIEDVRGEVRTVRREFATDSTGQSTLPALHLDAPRGAGIWTAPTPSDFRRAQSDVNKVRRTSLGQQKSTALIEDSTDSYRPREGFCECCDSKFNDFLTHINSEMHKEKMENHEVMAEIDDVLRAINKANGLLES
jgi:hypothetical protein